MLVTARQRFPAPLRGEAVAAAEIKAVERALDAGVAVVQLREKDLDGGLLFARACIFRELCQRYGALLLVNDRVDVALAAEADGVHLPASGLPVAAARALLPRGAIIGRSAHGESEIDAAAEADYVIFGPVYETHDKLVFGAPQGVVGLTAAVARSRPPLIAIGGIRPRHVAEVRRAGAAGVAAIGALLDDPSTAAGFVAGLAV
jgi:thiamine-phosphate pyrophosphorylase